MATWQFWTLVGALIFLAIDRNVRHAEAMRRAEEINNRMIEINQALQRLLDEVSCLPKRIVDCPSEPYRSDRS